MRRLGALLGTSVVTLAVLGGASAPAWASSPSLAGSVADPVNLSGAFSVAISGHYAYASAYYSGELTAIDISHPSAPAIVGNSAPNTGVQNADTVAVAGGYAYVVSKNRNASHSNNDDGSGNSLSIFDIHTNPAVPALVGQVHDAKLLFGAYGVAVEGNYAYVAAQGCLIGQPCPDHTVGNDVAVVDISNPANPRIVASVANPTSGALDHVDAVAVAGSFLYAAAAYSNSLTVISIANPLAPSIVAQLKDAAKLDSPNDLAVQGSDAYVADGSAPAGGGGGGLAVVDISNPTSPRVAGVVTSSRLNSAYRVRVSGHFAYVAADRADAISVIDVSAPAHPVLAATVQSKTHLYRTTGLDIAQGGRYIIATSPYLSTEGPNIGSYPPVPGQPGGPPATGTISVIDTDPGPVGIHLSAPSAGGVYAKGIRVAAAYTCTPSGPVALTSCSGTVPIGARIDTRKLGRHAFTVRGADQFGQTGATTITYTVIPDPVLSHVSQSARVWRERGRRSHRLPPLGTVFTFRLNERAKVTLTFVRQLGPGRIVGRKCVAQTRRNLSHHRACERTVPVRGTVTLLAYPGTHRVAFTGRISKHTTLRRGTYTVTVTASIGGASVSRTLTFTIA
jgi:hypothetical protein